MTSARLTAPKIEVKCSCGKRYRVSARKAGKRIRCKKCRLKIEVPDPDATADVSLRTRKVVLEELGLDPEAEPQEEETVYRCTMCNTKIPEDVLQDSYGPTGLVCGVCRESFGIGDGGSSNDGDGKKKKKKKQLDSWTRKGSSTKARNTAVAYASLFFIGIACFVHSIFDPGTLVTLASAGAVAFAGGHHIFQTHKPVEDEAPKKGKKKKKS